MLYRFNSAAANEVVMLAPHAEEVFAAIHRPLAQQGTIPTAQLPAVIAELGKAIEHSKQQVAASGKTADEHEQSNREAPIPFHTRAYPFLQLLIQSNQAGRDVSWG